MGWFSRSENISDIEYHSIDSVENLIEVSHEKPVFLLKHSNTCPISTHAKQEMDRFVSETGENAYLLVVQKQRPLSNEIAERLSVKHESPQALKIEKGSAVSVLNHSEIRSDILKQWLT